MEVISIRQFVYEGLSVRIEFSISIKTDDFMGLFATCFDVEEGEIEPPQPGIYEGRQPSSRPLCLPNLTAESSIQWKSGLALEPWARWPAVFRLLILTIS